MSQPSPYNIILHGPEDVNSPLPEDKFNAMVVELGKRSMALGDRAPEIKGFRWGSNVGHIHCGDMPAQDWAIGEIESISPKTLQCHKEM